jgi:hypothetical protein
MRFHLLASKEEINDEEGCTDRINPPVHRNLRCGRSGRSERPLTLVSHICASTSSIQRL